MNKLMAHDGLPFEKDLTNTCFLFEKSYCNVMVPYYHGDLYIGDCYLDWA
jgi:hypothetical protein